MLVIYVDSNCHVLAFLCAFILMFGAIVMFSSFMTPNLDLFD